MSEDISKAKMPIGVVWTVVSTAVAVTVVGLTAISAIRADITLLRADMAGSLGALDAKIQAVDARISATTAERYTMSMASEDALRRVLANPGHREPDPRNRGQYITATTGQHGLDVGKAN